MKKIFYCISVLFFLFVSAEGAFGYLGKSIRIMGFGDELAGVIQDEYTDIYRNPAYLSFVEKARVFGQYDLYRHTELKIAEHFTNQKTGLMGIVLPLAGYGNLALMGELKPSTAKNSSELTSQRESINYYIIDSSSVKWFKKETIRNFKLIYGLKLSPSLRLGIDFAYLKNYNDADSTKKTMNIQKHLYSDYLTHNKKEDRVNNYDSPDAQRGSIGIVFNSGQKTTLDFTLYYENLSYTKRASSNGKSETIWFRSDTTSAEGFHLGTEITPTKNRALGLDANFKYRFPQKTSLAILLGGRYQKNETSFSEQNKDSTYTDWVIELVSGQIFRQSNDKIFNFAMGIGAEKDFSPSIKIGVALKGYWDRKKLDRYEWQKSANISVIDDSVIIKSSSFWENHVKKTTNSYKLTFPIGAEVVLHKMIKARLGGGFIIKKKETETGYSTSSEDYYSQGLSLSYDERIFLDAYIRDELTPIGNWMVKVEYRF